MFPPCARRYLRPLRRIVERAFGTVVIEQEWRWRGVRWAEELLSEASQRHPHREWFQRQVLQRAPISSLLEVGCGSGVNLIGLAKGIPDGRVMGIDINPEAIRVGNAWFQGHCFNNVELMTGKAHDLGMFKNGSIDLVVTDACLMYVGPEKIRLALGEFGRIAREGFVFNEWHSGSIAGSTYDEHWVHNWEALMKELFPAAVTTIVPHPMSFFGGAWDKYGHVIDVRFEAELSGFRKRTE